MNDYVAIPLPPRISSYEISTRAKIKSKSFQFKEIPFKPYPVNISFRNYDGVTIKNCPDFDSGLDMLNQSCFIEKLNQSAETFIIIIDVDAAVSCDVETLSMLLSKLRKKYAIILFQTFNGSCQLFWKMLNKSFWLKLGIESSIFVIEFLAISLTNGHPGVPNDILSMTEKFIELNLLSLIDSRGYNLLMLAAQDGDASVVDSFIQHGFDVNVLVGDDTAIDLAYDNNHYGIVLALLYANSLYPRNINKVQLSDDLKKFIGISRELHNFIRQGKLDEVTAVLNDNPNIRHFYNTKNLSAASQAVICEQLDIYNLLLSKNVYIGPKEDFNAILRKVSETSCENMRGIHLNHIQSSSASHLMILTINSFVGHDVPDADEKMKHIAKGFEYLNKLDPLISLILKVVAASRNFKIIFDFHRPSIQHLDPTSSQFTRGVFHTSRHIYIAAQQLLNPETAHEIYGTMAHELCHYALHLVYQNACRPYFENDASMFKHFTNIAMLCKLRKKQEPLIDFVFDAYTEPFQHAELIVRVPHMIAEYSKNPEKLKIKRLEYPELFQYAENVVAVQMEKSLPDIQTQADDENKKYAHRIEKKERENFWLWIFSIFCILTLPLMVYVTLWMSNTTKPVYSCANLTDQRYKIMESTVNFQGVPVIFRDLFGNATDSCKDLTTAEISHMLDIYDSGRFLNGSNIFYENENDTNIIQNEQGTKTTDIFDRYKTFNFRVPSLNVSMKVVYKAPFYIGRRVHEKQNFGNRNVFSFDELKGSKIVFFSDFAGNGKSTTFRRATWKLKRSLPLHWVSYVDLKDHIEALKILELEKVNIADFIGENILKLSSDVDKHIFKEKFKSNKTVILWDAVDEVSPIFTEKILDLIEIISNSTNNNQWISSRVHLEKKIKSKFDVKIYSLAVYNAKEKDAFIKSFLKINNVTDEVARTIEKRIESTILKLEKSGNPNNLQKIEINTPLMMKMICDRQLQLYKEDSTYSNSTDTINIYTLYEYFVDRHFEIAYKNKSDIVLKDVETVQKLYKNHNNMHQYNALLEIFGTTELIDIITDDHIEFNNLGIIKMYKNNQLVTNEQLTRFGIMYENPARKLKFEHKTFAEFFVAQFFYDNLWNEYTDSIDSFELKLRLQLLLFVIKNGKDYKIILDFIDGFLDIKSSYQASFGTKVRQIINEEYGDYLNHLNLDINSISLATKFFKKDKEIIRKFWKFDENFTFFLEFFLQKFSISESLNLFDQLQNVVTENFDKYDKIKILNGVNQKIYILYRIWNEQFNYIDYNTTIPNISAIYKNLTYIQTNKILDFLNYVNTLNYSKLDFREFFQHTLAECFDVLNGYNDEFLIYWKFIENKLDDQDIKLILFQKQRRFDSILFLINKFGQSESTKTTIDFIERHLNASDIVDLLLKREGKENSTFMSYEVEHQNFDASNLTWPFAQRYTTVEQQKELLSSFNGTIRTLKTVWNLKNIILLNFYHKIFKNLYTNAEICSMIGELSYNLEIFVVDTEVVNRHPLFELLNNKRHDFLEEVCEGDEVRLASIYSNIHEFFIR